MKQLSIFLTLFLALQSCNNTDCIDPMASDCINQKIEAFKTQHQNNSNRFIEKAAYKGQLVFIFDDCTVCDGPATVLNNSCDTLGILCGECFQSNFQKDFWKKAKNKERIWR